MYILQYPIVPTHSPLTRRRNEDDDDNDNVGVGVGVVSEMRTNLDWLLLHARPKMEETKFYKFFLEEGNVYFFLSVSHL